MVVIGSGYEDCRLLLPVAGPGGGAAKKRTRGQAFRGVPVRGRGRGIGSIGRGAGTRHLSEPGASGERANPAAISTILVEQGRA